MKELSQTALLVLASLIPDPLHGYGIKKEVARLSQGKVDMTIGTLYEHINRLLRLGYIERAGEGRADGGRVRKYYKITAVGMQDYEAHLQLFEERLTQMKARLPRPVEARREVLHGSG
jgi:DNA-binding PadR family transcriptional regulator